MNKEEELLASGYSKVDMPIEVGSYSVEDDGIKKAIAFNDSEVQLDPDLMYIRFIMAHEGANANGDFFTKEVLQRAQYTPRYKPVDWEHGQPMIGTMLDSKYAEEAGGRGYIEAIGVVWKFIYPELAEQIKKKSATGELKLSMECYYRDSNYMVGDAIYDQETAKELGIIQYVGREYMGKKVLRVFKEVVFGGVGVVANPADKEAVFLAVAKDLDIDPSEVTEEILNQAVSEIINRSINDFKEKLQQHKDTATSVAIARYVKAFDKAKSGVVSKFNKEELQTKEEVIRFVNATMNNLLSEVSTISNSYYKQVASEDDGRSIAEHSLDDIQDKISKKTFEHYLQHELEAYLIVTYADYFIYELYDYESGEVKLFKATYSITEDGVSIDFTSAVEVEKVYKEKTHENQEGGQNMAKSKETKVEATEEVVEQAKANEEVVEQVEATETVEETTEKVEATEEVVKEEVVEQVEASEVEKELESVKQELATIKSEKESLETELATIKSELADIRATETAEARYNELKEAGIELSEARKAKLKEMDETSYAEFKDLLIEVASKKVEKVEEEVVESAEASEETVEEVVEEEVTVEDVDTASAGINIETEVKKAPKPFGHLSN